MGLTPGATETYFRYDAANALAHAHALPWQKPGPESSHRSADGE